MSLSEAQQKVEDNPQDVEALRDLATAQQSAGQIAAAAKTLDRFLALRPNDTAVAAQLAGLYDQQARAATAEAQALTDALVKFDVAMGTKRANALSNAQRDVDDYRLTSEERYRDNMTAQ